MRDTLYLWPQGIGRASAESWIFQTLNAAGWNTDMISSNIASREGKRSSS